MTDLFTQFTKELEKGISLIDKHYPIATNNQDSGAMGNPSEGVVVSTQSLLDRCNIVTEKYKKKKPKIRIIHHFACSGGTLISKCLAAMPNVYILSEIHPYHNLRVHLTEKPIFSPTDVTRLCKYANIPNWRELADKLFMESIVNAYQHADKQGGLLVLRDHSHSDYCLGELPQSRRFVFEILQEKFEVVSLVTVRDPIDSYRSLVGNGWFFFKPATFDEYCRRLLIFLDDYSGSKIVMYDNFVIEPEVVMQEICSGLEIEYNELFVDIFDQFRVTGDSGRSGSVIFPRKRRNLSDEYKREIEASPYYEKILKVLNCMIK